METHVYTIALLIAFTLGCMVTYAITWIVFVEMKSDDLTDISNEMKADCMGEFWVDYEYFDDDDEYQTAKVMIPWTTMKDIYKRMVKHKQVIS